MNLVIMLVCGLAWGQEPVEPAPDVEPAESADEAADEVRQAFIGVRPCELHAIAILDRLCHHAVAVLDEAARI